MKIELKGKEFELDFVLRFLEEASKDQFSDPSVVRITTDEAKQLAEVLIEMSVLEENEHGGWDDIMCTRLYRILSPNGKT